MLNHQSDLAALGAKALVRVKTEYDADNIAQQTINLYQEVLK